MAIHRCPECGGRLNTNYCDICMRKVPFAGARPQKHRDPWEYSSAHREEAGHKCITFDMTQADRPKQTFTKNKTTFTKQTPTFPKTKSAKKSDPKKATIVAVALALLSLLPTVFGAIEDLHIDNPTPEYNAEAFAPDADLPVVQPTGLYSNGEIEIYADSLGLYYDEPSLSFLIENQSEQDIDVVIEKVSVNGYMVDYGMTTEVNAGDSCQAFLCLYRYALENANIQQIAYIDFNLRIYDRDSYDQIGYVEAMRVETDIADSYTQYVDRSGLEVYNDGSTCVMLRDITLSGYGSGEIGVFVENASSDDVMVYTTDVYINGQKADGYLGCSLTPGTCAVTSVYLSDLEALDIQELDQIKEVTLELYVDYMDGWELLETNSVSVTVEPGAIK